MSLGSATFEILEVTSADGLGSDGLELREPVNLGWAMGASLPSWGRRGT